MKIKIPTENIESLSKKITALANKAERLELPPITMNINYTIGIATPDKKNPGKYTENEFYLIDILGEPPVLEGWKFIGIVEPTEAGNLLIEINPDNKIPDKYRHTDLCDCEHCGIKRERLSAFIVENNETGEVLQVGRVCLKSYTGDTDPKNIALYESFFKLKEFENKLSYGTYQPIAYNPEVILAYYFKARELHPELYKNDLKMIALNTISLYQDEPYKTANLLREIRKEVSGKLEDIDYIKAKEFIQSINELMDTGNNRVWNYKLVLNENYTIHSQVVLQAIEFKEAYDLNLTIEAQRLEKQLEKIKQQQELLEAKKLRNHIGNVDEKIKLEVRLDYFSITDNQYGTTYIHTFRDKNENNITWFCSGSPMFNPQERDSLIKDKTTFYIQGTISNHQNYNDEPQTKISRVKFLGIDEPIEIIKKTRKSKII